MVIFVRFQVSFGHPLVIKGDFWSFLQCVLMAMARAVPRAMLWHGPRHGPRHGRRYKAISRSLRGISGKFWSFLVDLRGVLVIPS